MYGVIAMLCCVNVNNSIMIAKHNLGLRLRLLGMRVSP